MKEQLTEVVRSRGLIRFDAPVTLASGGQSREFVDGKAALARGADLELACRAMLAEFADIDFDCIGGLTMGADQFAHVVAVLGHKSWFVVRKEAKGRGTAKLVEGTALGPDVRVLLVDDVVTTGGSIQRAHSAVSELGAVVVGAAALVDRGELASRFFAERDIPYRPLVTYRDLGIEPVATN
ncbi:MAG: orotate phosphoribosyltransferase [Acidimicrobiales bacterium]